MKEAFVVVAGQVTELIGGWFESGEGWLGTGEGCCCRSERFNIPQRRIKSRFSFLRRTFCEDTKKDSYVTVDVFVV